LSSSQTGIMHNYKWHTIQIIIVIGVAVALSVFIYYLAVFTQYIPITITNYLYVAILVVAGYLVIRITSRIISKYGASELETTHVVALKNLFQITAAIVLALVVAFALGINVTSALVGAGFLGIVLGLAAQTVLGNVFAGIALLVSRQFKVGDRLTINSGKYGYIAQSYPHDGLIPGYTGVVTDISLTHTTMMGDDNVPMTFPNSVLIQSMIFDHSLVKKRTVRIRMDVHRDIPLDQFRDAMKQALKDDPRIDGASPVEINPLIVAENTYNVAITAWMKGTLEEPGKAVLINKAIEVVKELRRRAGTDVYKNSPIRIGDQVIVRGEYGTVEDVTPRFTIVKTWDNRRQVIPNQVLDSEVLINYTLTDPKKLFTLMFYVPYDTDLDKAREVMVQEAREHPNVLKTLDPIFQVLDFAEGAIALRLLFMAKDQPTAFNAGCDLRFSIKRQFDKAGIKLSCPARYIIPESKIRVDQLPNDEVSK
jgi:small-conductance mechanosensitive channel